MKTALRSVPIVLVLSRIVLSPLIWWTVHRGLSPWWFMAGFVLAYATDIFDGKIARRLGVATPALRLVDGWVDTRLYF